MHHGYIFLQVRKPVAHWESYILMCAIRTPVGNQIRRSLESGNKGPEKELIWGNSSEPCKANASCLTLGISDGTQTK